MPKRKKNKAKTKKQIIAAIEKVDADGLNPRRILFCQYFVFNDLLRNNATFCYGEAYDFHLDELPNDDAKYKGTGKNREMVEASTYSKACNTCAVNGLRLLRNTKIQEYLVKLRNIWLSDDIVDSELAKVISQNEDYAPKVAAIKEYNKLRKRTDPDNLPPGESVVQYIQINVHDPIEGTKAARHISESKAIPRMAGIAGS